MAVGSRSDRRVAAGGAARRPRCAPAKWKRPGFGCQTPNEVMDRPAPSRCGLGVAEAWPKLPLSKNPATLASAVAVGEFGGASSAWRGCRRTWLRCCAACCSSFTLVEIRAIRPAAGHDDGLACRRESTLNPTQFLFASTRWRDSLAGIRQ